MRTDGGTPLGALARTVLRRADLDAALRTVGRRPFRRKRGQVHQGSNLLTFPRLLTQRSKSSQ